MQLITGQSPNISVECMKADNTPTPVHYLI